jgi:purine-binding chemotaxis protein CheW
MLSLGGNEVGATVSTLSIPAARQGTATPGRFVTFRLHGQLFAIPLKHEDRALRMVAVTPVPNAPSGVLGILNMSGRLVPALDLRPCLGLQAKSPGASDRLLILTIEGNIVAVFANEVCAVTTLTAQPVETAIATLTHSELVMATLHHDGDVIFVLDVVQVAAIIENAKELR